MSDSIRISEIDLSSLSIRELEELAERVAIATKERRRSRSTELLEEFAKTAELEGLRLEEVVGQSPGRRRKNQTVRFRDPDDLSLTWSGRGPRPDWVKQAIASGTPLESLRVNFTDVTRQCRKEDV